MQFDAIFSDGLVLQAGKPIRMFGQGEGYGEIRIGSQSVCFVSENAFWQVELPAMDYGGPWTVTARFNGQETVLNDVYLGDVYLLAGQSNLQFLLS